MPASRRSVAWRLVQASDAECAAFKDLDTVLRAAGERVGPRNRYREVRRVEHGGRVYFLKVFHHTQWKNRLRNRVTEPRCGLDAERELAIAEALTARGIETARPVALGRRDGASYYLCAALPGAPLRDLLAEGRCGRELSMQVARFAGGIARHGVVLTDLSADHVFVDRPERGPPGFAVIDLHNGAIRRRMSRRAGRRALRRFRASVRGLPVGHGAALAFAVRFLKAAGLGRHSRAILATLAPIDTHGRYDVPGRSNAYRHRNPARNRRELALLREVWPGRPGDAVLDAPCGAGRLLDFLAGDLGARAAGADRSIAMLREAREALAARAAQAPVPPTALADARHLPFEDRAFDGVVVFRFLHHLPDDAARAVVLEAARVADRYLVVSFFHPLSLHNLQRSIARALTGRARTRFWLRPGRLRAWLAPLGFRQDRLAADQRFLRDLWIASFRRG